MIYKKLSLQALLALFISLLACAIVLAQSLPQIHVFGISVKKVTSTPVLTFSLNKPTVSLIKGETAQNPAQTNQPTSQGAITYQSSDSQIARVTNTGQVEAVAEGTATITAMQAADLPKFEAGKASYQVVVKGVLTAATNTNAATAPSSVTAGSKVNFTPVTVSGGIGALTYTISPALPAGLNLNPTTGVITGTPTGASPPTSYTVTVTDSASPAHTTTGSFTLEVAVALTASTAVANRSAAVHDVLSNYTPVTAAGGTGPLAYSVAPTLPTGLSMNPTTGVITGTAGATAASTTYTVTVTDSASPVRSATANFTLEVVATLAATPPPANKTTTTVTANEAVNFTPVTPTGGAGPLTYTVSPALPAGLNLNPTTGVITGTPTGASPPTSYTVTVTDSAVPPHTTTGTFTLEVAGVLKATTAIANRSAAVNDVISNYTPVTATGGTGALTYSVSPVLPNGLSMNATTGAITGTAAAIKASTSYTVTVTDKASPAHSATANFTLAVDAALTATTAVANRTALVGELVTYKPVTGAGGTGALTYSVSPALPAGLSMNATNGVIDSTTTAATNPASYTVTVTDSASPAHTATASFTLTVRGFYLLSNLGLGDGHGRIDQIGDTVSFSPVEVKGKIVGTVGYSVSPALPAGLSMNTSTGLISGTPTGAATIRQDYTVTVTDSAAPGVSDTAGFSYEVRDKFRVAAAGGSQLLIQGRSVNYAPVTASGGVPDNVSQPRTFTVSPALPAGLTMSQVYTGSGTSMTSSYLITGTPTGTSPSTTYTVTVTDGRSNGSAVRSATANFVLQVSAGAFTVRTAETNIMLQPGTYVRGNPVVGENGYGNYTYSLSPASLPAGLSFDSTTGSITGTVGAVNGLFRGDYTVTVTDRNSAGPETTINTGNFTLVIHGANSGGDSGG